MIELNKWFFVQLINFLILLFLLNVIFFRPLLNLFRERKENIDGAIEEAKSLTVRKEEAFKRYQAELIAAREKAKDIYGSLRQDGLSEQKRMIMEANEEAFRYIQEARGKLRGESERARKELREYLERFSDEIVRKLVEV